MPERSQTGPSPVQTVPDLQHPTWCDRTRCTANPAATTGNGYRATTAGQHQSAPIRLDLTTVIALPPRISEAYLTEAVAPWPCETYLRLRHGDAEIAMTASDAARALSALRLLTATAEAEGR